MKKLFETADAYVKSSNWKDLALIKFCLFSIGLMVGTRVGRKNKRPVFLAALAVFVATYIPLMVKYIRVLLEKKIVDEDTATFADYIPE